MATATVDSARRSLDRASQRVLNTQWFRTLARAGHAAKGWMYLVLGGLSLQLAFGARSDAPSAREALQQSLRVPFGRWLLGLLAVGLLAYAAWRALEAWVDPDGLGTDAKGVAKRLGIAVSAVLHVGLGVAAAGMALGNGRAGGGGSGSDGWMARALAQPGGVFLVAAVGVAIGVAGVSQITKGVQKKFLSKLSLSGVAQRARRAVVTVSQVGFIARGVVFGVLGLLVVGAAVRSDPSQASGMEDALKVLLTAPWGSTLLAGVAVGFVCYAAFMFLMARYRRLPRSA